MKKVLCCMLLCIVLTACGEDASGLPTEITLQSKNEDLLLNAAEVGNALAGDNSVDLSSYEKGSNGLPVVPMQDLKDNPSGFEELGLYRLGFDWSGEFMVNPTKYELDGVAIDFTDFDSVAKGISDFSQVFYMASGGSNGVEDNGIKPTDVSDIKAWLNKNIGAVREVKFTSEEMKGLSSDCNIDIVMVLTAENTIDYLSIKLYSSSKLSDQPIVVFDEVGVNLTAVTKSGTQKLDFRYDF